MKQPAPTIAPVAAIDPDALPAAGGSYVRLPDGSLMRLPLTLPLAVTADPVEAPVALPTKE